MSVDSHKVTQPSAQSGCANGSGFFNLYHALHALRVRRLNQMAGLLMRNLADSYKSQGHAPRKSSKT
jgi:hypothetical protein